MHEPMRQFDVTNRVEHHEARYLERIAFHLRKRRACRECEFEPRIMNETHRLAGVVLKQTSIRVCKRGDWFSKHTLQRGSATRDLTLLVRNGCEGQCWVRQRV